MAGDNPMYNRALSARTGAVAGTMPRTAGVLPANSALRAELVACRVYSTNMESMLGLGRGAASTESNKRVTHMHGLGCTLGHGTSWRWMKKGEKEMVNHASTEGND